MPRKPPIFHSFVGQRDRIAHPLKLFDNAIVRGLPCPHALFTGASGLGKTRLARALAEASGTNCLEAHGRETRDAMLSKLLRLEANDLLFIDEAHNLRPVVQELLYPVIDERRVFVAEDGGQQGGGPEPRSIEIQPCTIILATDQPGRLLQALIRRMIMTVPLRPYNESEMQEVVRQLATELGLLLKPHASNHIAAVSGGLPRKARQLLQQLALYIPDAVEREITLPAVRAFLKSAGVDGDGLGAEHRNYLDMLHTFSKASLPTLSGALRIDPAWIQSEIEAQLIRLGLVRIGAGGRQLTEQGLAWMKTNETIS
jgi:Holliday junction DNA helicase RuvB